MMNDSSPVVSVIIPTYNSEKYLRESIQSVLDQTYQDFELIITDNASCDNTEKIAKEIVSQPKIKYYRNKENIGAAKNFNTGLLMAQGRYIKMLCSDDIIMPNYLSEAVGVLDSFDQVSLVTSFEKFIGSRSDIRKLGALPAFGKLDGKRVQQHVMENGNWIGGPTAVTFRKRDLSVGLFNPDLKGSLDYDLWLRLLSVGDLYVIPKILFSSRIHAQQETSKCVQDLLFEKEKVLIANAHILFPEQYGSFSDANMRSFSKKSIQELIMRSIKTKNLKNTRDSFVFLLKIHQKRLLKTTLGAPFPFFASRIYPKFKRAFCIVYAKLSAFLPERWKSLYEFKPQKLAIQINPQVNDSIVQTWGTIKVPADNIRVRLWTPEGLRLQKISDTPHFKWIQELVSDTKDCESRAAYREYVETYYPEVDPEWQLERIVHLVGSIAKSQTHDLNIVSYKPVRFSSSYLAVLYDGNHRAAISKALGLDSINCKVLKETVDVRDFSKNLLQY